MLLLTAALAASTALANPAGQDQAWRQYATPEEAGFDAGALEAARGFAQEMDSAAVIALYRGSVVCAWGDVERRFKCHSVRKSILSALIGIHVEDGKIDLEETLASLEIDDREPLTESEKQARVVDLLCARSGVYHPAAKEPSDMSANRPARESHAPGTHWWYNNWDFNTLVTIFEKRSGTRVFEEFERRLAQPLGMEDFRLGDAYYQLEPSKSIHPAYAFRLSARDLARFGQLFLQRGSWNGEQLVPASWVEDSTQSHSRVPGGSGGGYGYMWWSHPVGTFDGFGMDKLNALESFAARGTGGQFVLVVPEAEFVFVHRGDTDNDRRVNGGRIWALAERLLQAQTGEAADSPQLGPLQVVPFANPGPKPPEYTPVEIDPEVLHDYEGQYEFMPGAPLQVYVYSERLFASSARGELELFPLSATRFFARSADLVVEFVRGEGGAITSIRGKLEGRDLEAARL